MKKRGKGVKSKKTNPEQDHYLIRIKQGEQMGGDLGKWCFHVCSDPQLRGKLGMSLKY
jgi:hypothetical protein